MRRLAAQRRFLTCFSGTGNVLQSSRAAKIGATQHYRWMAEDPTYPSRFREAQRLAICALEDEAIRRGHEGVKRLVRYKGRPVKLSDGTYLFETEYSDNLLMFLLKSYDRERFGDKTENTFGPNWNGNLEDLPEEFLRQVLAQIEAQAAALEAKQLEARAQTTDVTLQPPTPGRQS